MTAPLICIVGESGSGKTTLVRHLLRIDSQMRYLKYVTTRQPRSFRERFFSFEYSFVSSAKYGKLKETSQQWEELQAGGFFYGVQVDLIERLRDKGISFLSTMLPQRSSIESRLEVYRNPVKFIYLQVSEEVLGQRGLSRERANRRFDTLDELSDLIDVTFLQTGNLKIDLQKCVQEILQLY